MSAPGRYGAQVVAGGQASVAGRTGTDDARWAFRLALLLQAVAALFVLLSFDHHGISNDEEVQHVYGGLLLDFYASGLSDGRAFAYKNLYLYGGLFDLAAAGLERGLGLDPAAPAIWHLRHLLAAGFGLAGLAGCWALARRLAGEWVGLAALAVLMLTGAWTGAMFTHTKDVPFAATMVWALYFTVAVVDALPRPSLASLLGLGAALGCAFGLRVGAVFAVFDLGVAMLAAAALRGGAGVGATLAWLGRSAVALWPAGLLALVLMGVFWPWAVMAPGNLLKSMTAFSHFAFDLKTMLAGELMPNGEVPGHYLLSYLLVRLPEVFLLGLAFAALAGLGALPTLLRPAGRRAALPWLPVVLAGLFPLAYTLAAAPPLYNGLRHFTFLLPPLAVLAAAGYGAAWRWGALWPRLRVALLAGCALLAAGQAAALARLHPYEYLAYNAVVGGLPGASARWEQDYWADSLREAAEQLNALVRREGGRGRSYAVAVCAEPLQAEVWLAPPLSVTRDWRAADFFIAPTHMACHTALAGRVVGTVERDGVTLAVVRDRRMLVGDERRPR